MSYSNPDDHVRRTGTAKRLGFALALLAAFYASYAFGRHAAARAALSVHQSRDALTGLNDLAQYHSLSSIAVDLRAGRQGFAQCTAEVAASARLGDIRKCLSNESCRTVVIDEIRRTAPELLVPGAELGFRFYKAGEPCIPANNSR